ncbi:hypothetical protein TPHA_0M01130 [Tetrapisispora phaffii CBS 4417]|uniref:Origin recognition complex subunit 2 n=1 Tax=Tetrapisispora phaffii (strain ATCC 24235 / CBS 4417 / NBRC 1672 / NRRL Y-8282 / UCD 70-5) TaxID=1071381 RepID=G8C0H3_TETPH|nr:hypothetical protein TPHA_0M01130 [Tetrapisispora phaffii CBS 4417]CCE65688.1 hypothetical protein TPHA_0M01130 [Tetrapisispora phaffii CBS 4417]
MSSPDSKNDIVEHVDILSSPSKLTYNVNSRPFIVTKKSNNRRQATRKRMSIEQIISPQKKSTRIDLEPVNLKSNEHEISHDDKSSSIFENEIKINEMLQSNGSKDTSDDNISTASGRRTRRKKVLSYNYDEGDDNIHNDKSSGDDESFQLNESEKVVEDEKEESSYVDEINDLDSSTINIKDENEALGVDLKQEPELKQEIRNNKKYSYISSLKKEILKNIGDDKKKMKGDLKPLQLTKNFKNTPLPDSNQYKPPMEKIIGSFFDTFEGYFDQRRSVRSRDKSKNTMANSKTVTREEFVAITSAFNNSLLKSSRNYLFKKQRNLYPQYWFEVSQGFSLLFYGIGSKHSYLEDFVFNYLSPELAYAAIANNPHKKITTGIPCIIINGYNPICNYRDVSKDITEALYPDELNRNESKYWDNHVLLKLQKMVEYYKTQPQDIKLIILVHNLDGPSTRKDTFQVMLSTLARIRQVALVASTDNINAPILWDNMKAQDFNFIYHDVTNFEPRQIESSFQDVMKLGSSDTKNTLEGAKYVLQSLTKNSKKMYKLLLETQLTNVELNNFSKSAKQGLAAIGVEFRTFLSECSNQFIAYNEVSLRSMLTEFIEHKMATITKDTRGAEKIWIPYSYVEIKKLLKEVLTDI